MTMDGKLLVLHGHRTSHGCPLISGLNGTAGWGDESGTHVPTDFFLNSAGEWVAKTKTNEQQFDEQTHLVSSGIAGVPYYVQTNDGRVFSGHVDEGGTLPRIDTYGEDEYTVLWGDEALAKLAENPA